MEKLIAPLLYHELLRSFFIFRSARIADENRVRKKRELCCTLDQALYFYRLIILQRYVKPPRPLLFVHPRRRSPPIGQFRSSPHALKGRWGLRAFKRRASVHSSFCVTCGHFAGSRQCVWRTRVCITPRDGIVYRFRVAIEWSIDALIDVWVVTIDRDRENAGETFRSYRQCVSVVFHSFKIFKTVCSKEHFWVCRIVLWLHSVT